MKFSIRDLLLVTIIVAICLAWWLDHRRLVQTVEPLMKTAREADERFDSLRSLVEMEGVEVYSERKENGELHMSVMFPAPGSLPNSSAPAPSLPKP